MNQNYRNQWIIIPDQLPSVLKRCSGCGKKTEFKNSGKFRVNANGRLLDIWLIFRCCRCETSFNLAIYERVEAGHVDKKEYKGFLDNSLELAFKYGNDREVFARNKAEVSKNLSKYRVMTGATSIPCLAEAMEVEIQISPVFDLRVDTLLMRQLSVSRNVIKKWCEEGLILKKGQMLSYKSRVKDSMVLSFYGPAGDALTKT